MLCGIAFIAVTRWLVRWGAASVSFMRTSSLLVANLLIALGLIIAPLLLAVATFRPLSPWPLVCAIALFSNTVTALAAMAFFVLFAALMLIHQLLWPIVARPLYLITNERLLMHRKTLICAGLAFIGIAVPGAAGFVERLVK